MKRFSTGLLIISSVFALLFLSASIPLTARADMMGKANAAFNADKMGDMSDFDPANPVVPTGDTIKIAIVASFSGPAALNGQIYWAVVQWVAHDINKRGGIMVDGKKKLVQVIKADHTGKPDQCKLICERMALQEKVHIFWGTDGSHLAKIMNDTANKYKIISINTMSLSDDLMDATNFGRYSFQTAYSTEQVGRAFAYFYGQVRKKEKRFYILCQDYSFGHKLAESFKKGLKEYYPKAQLVGEDYHKLFLTDYASYLEKIKASGAEVIFTGDWLPDAGNLLKQSRQMGIMIPFANIYMDEPNSLHEAGVKGTKGLINLSVDFNGPNPYFKTPGSIKFYKAWNGQWKKWKTPPFDSRLFEHLAGNGGAWAMHTYWLLSVVERVQSTDPEKIIALWEDDSYKFANGKVVKMRACDHKVIQNFGICEYVPWEQQKVSMSIPPYYWYKGQSAVGPTWTVPAEKALPWMDQKLDRCVGKNGWGK